MLKIVNRVFAQEEVDTTGGNPGSIDNPIGPNNQNLLQLLERLVDVLIQYGIVIAAFFIIYSGFLFVTARGNEGKVESAKKTFWYTILGAAILLGAKVIIVVIAETIETL